MTMNFQPQPSANFAAAFQALIDEAMEISAQEREPRDYLGGSRLGVECLRALGYEYHHVSVDPGKHFPGKILRAFDIGHDSETRMAEYMRLAGFTMLTERPDGQQFGFGIAPHPETGRSRVAGHIDGVITAGPMGLGRMLDDTVGAERAEFPMLYPALWEMKALNNKSWNDTRCKGVEKSKPVYYVQMQTYMAYLGLGDYPALFTALNKDTGEIYAELVPYVPAVAQRASDKGVMVISSASPEDLPRVSAGRTDFRCKRCNWSNRCWSAKAAPAQPVAQAPAFWGNSAS